MVPPVPLVYLHVDSKRTKQVQCNVQTLPVPPVEALHWRWIGSSNLRTVLGKCDCFDDRPQDLQLRVHAVTESFDIFITVVKLLHRYYYSFLYFIFISFVLKPGSWVLLALAPSRWPTCQGVLVHDCSRILRD